MDDKLKALTEQAKFESTGTPSPMEKFENYVYYTATAGGYRPIFKSLITNKCVNDCKYCINRRSNNIPRYQFSPEDFAGIINEFYKKGKISGAFISSGVFPDTDQAMGKLYRTAWLLRKKYTYNGYLHVKIMPGTSPIIIGLVSEIADRISVNLETINSECLREIAPDKKGKVVMETLKTISKMNSSKTTQIMPGVIEDNDFQILTLAHKIYKNLKINRMYYSSYRKIEGGPEGKKQDNNREFRLYQADKLLKNYNFEVEDIIIDKNLSSDMDPKLSWALRNINFFPVDINKAPRNVLLRVPGIGPKKADEIIKKRNENLITMYNIFQLSLYDKSFHFLICKGTYLGEKLDEKYIKSKLLKNKDYNKMKNMSLFE